MSHTNSQFQFVFGSEDLGFESQTLDSHQGQYKLIAIEVLFVQSFYDGNVNSLADSWEEKSWTLYQSAVIEWWLVVEVRLHIFLNK